MLLDRATSFLALAVAILLSVGRRWGDVWDLLGVGVLAAYLGDTDV